MSSKARPGALPSAFAVLAFLSLVPGRARGQAIVKVTAFFERIVPKVKPVAAAIRATNHAGLQIQVDYF